MTLYSVEGSSNNYREPKVRGNYLRVPRRYIRPQSPQNAVFIPILPWFMYIMGKQSQNITKVIGLNHYCKIWKLKINVLKKKVVIFANRQPKQLPVFHLGDLVVEVTSGYTYLGVYMKYNGNMLPGIIRLTQQANRAMYSLLQRSRKLGLGIDIIMQLFDSLVVSDSCIRMRSVGFKHAEVMEGLHLQFARSY